MTNNNIKISRVIVNFIFFNLYWLLASIIFSIVFPLVLNLFGKPILDPADPIFVKIQIVIIVLMLVVSLIYRKFFYLPIYSNVEEVIKTLKKEESKEEKIEEIKKEEKVEDDILDIKTGREVK